MSTLTQKGVSTIKSIIDSTVTSSYPGISLAVTNKRGDNVLSYSAGKIGAETNEPMTEQNLFWTASVTKIVASICVLQLVEAGKLRLDDHEQLYLILPELKNLPIVSTLEDGALKLTPRKNHITLRILLTHTSGLVLPYDNASAAFNEFFDLSYDKGAVPRDILFPLLFEPGTRWAYGGGIDWACIALERVSGLKLDDYMKKYVTGPCGVNDDVTFVLTDDQRSRLVKMNAKDPETGKLKERPQFTKTALEPTESSAFLHRGGGGMFCSPSEFIKIMAMVLNDGVSPHTGKQVLKKETVDMMFTNQIPEMPNFLQDAGMTRSMGQCFPQSGPQGWGLSWLLTLTPSDFHCSPGTGSWFGACNVFAWCDREKGIAAMVAGQSVPPNDKPIVSAWRDAEKIIYESLIEGSK